MLFTVICNAVFFPSKASLLLFGFRGKVVKIDFFNPGLIQTSHSQPASLPSLNPISLPVAAHQTKCLQANTLSSPSSILTQVIQQIWYRTPTAKLPIIISFSPPLSPSGSLSADIVDKVCLCWHKNIFQPYPSCSSLSLSPACPRMRLGSLHRLRGVSLLLLLQTTTSMVMLPNSTGWEQILDKYLDEDGDRWEAKQRGKRAITDSDAQLILDLHNKLRGQVYPPASNMEYMVGGGVVCASSVIRSSCS